MKTLKKFLSCVTAAALALALGAGLPAATVYAESGSVYSCTINRCYSHPVTGVIEDSGGEASYATGQGMVEGCVYSSGLMEVSDSGNYYLTIRMSLMDYTSDHNFVVQNVGDSGWMSTAAAISATGSDTNGTTADVCIQVPSENCVVRGSMYVEPMGRNVVFYLYPSNYTSGNSVGMTPSIVTESSGSTSTQSDTSTTSTTTGTTSSGNSALSSGSTDESSTTTDTADTTDTSAESTTDSTSGGLTSTLSSSTEGISSTSEEGSASTDSSLNSAQGLSLSTAADAETGSAASGTSAGQIAAMGVTITISGIILMLVAAALICWLRKNWRRWGGEDDDDTYEE